MYQIFRSSKNESITVVDNRKIRYRLDNASTNLNQSELIIKGLFDTIYASRIWYLCSSPNIALLSDEIFPIELGRHATCRPHSLTVHRPDYTRSPYPSLYRGIEVLVSVFEPFESSASQPLLKKTTIASLTVRSTVRQHRQLIADLT